MAKSKKDQIRDLLKSIETGDPEPVAVVNEAKYIQHNPQTQEGSEGLAALFKRLSLTNPRVNIVRAFEDGDFVFAHTEYDFASRKIGFELFRFEDGQAVEHWDNIQPRVEPTPRGGTMVEGPTEARDHAATEANRSQVASFVTTVLIEGRHDALGTFIDDEKFVDHNPRFGGGVSELKAALGAASESVIDYQRLHRVVAEGNFVLSVSEGTLDGMHSSFYDLFRLSEGRIVEHWDTTEKIAPKSEWKNDNGKF